MKPAPFLHLSELLLRMRQFAGKGAFTPRALESKEQFIGRAAQLAETYWGGTNGTESELRPRVTLSALCLSMPRLCVYKMRPEAVKVVQETDLRSIPASPPRLFKSAFLIETCEPTLDRITDIGGFLLDGQYWILGCRFPDKMLIDIWTPTWGGSNDLLTSSEFGQNLTKEEIEDTLRRAGDALNFALTLGLLLDAEGSPFDQVETVERMGSLRKQKKIRETTNTKRNEVGWTIRTISIPVPYHPSPLRPAGFDTPGEADLSNLHPELTPVRGYLQRKPTKDGPKWVYVQPYKAIRWMGDRPTRVVVTRTPG